MNILSFQSFEMQIKQRNGVFTSKKKNISV